MRKINSDLTFGYEELEKDEKYFDSLLCLLIITFYFIDSIFFLGFLRVFSLFPVFHLLWKRTLPSCVTIFAFLWGSLRRRDWPFPKFSIVCLLGFVFFSWIRGSPRFKIVKFYSFFYFKNTVLVGRYNFFFIWSRKIFCLIAILLFPPSIHVYFGGSS